MKPPMTPTPLDVVEAMVALARPSGKDVLYDLGCGDGRIVIAAIRAGAGRAVGIDNDSQWIEIAQRNAQIAGVAGRAVFLTQNIFDSDISQASIVTLYTDAWTTLKLKSKLLTELAPGCRVISHSYGMCEWVPDHRVVVNGRALFLWVIPEQKALGTSYVLSDQRKRVLHVDTTPKRGISIRLEWNGSCQHSSSTCQTVAHSGELPGTPSLPLLRITNQDRYRLAAVLIRCRFEALEGRRTSTGRFSYLFGSSILASEARFPNTPQTIHLPCILSDTVFLLRHDKLAAFCMTRLSDDLWQTGLASLESVAFANDVC